MAKILVIEDEEALRQLVQRMLHQAGHKVLVASGSVNGLRLWQSSKIDLVVADLGLPDRNGLESIMEMRTLEPGLPLIVISGRGEVELIDLLTGVGLMSSVRIVNKPFKAEELLAAVQETLGNPPRDERAPG